MKNKKLKLSLKVLQIYNWIKTAETKVWTTNHFNIHYCAFASKNSYIHSEDFPTFSVWELFFIFIPKGQ